MKVYLLSNHEQVLNFLQDNLFFEPNDWTRDG